MKFTLFSTKVGNYFRRGEMEITICKEFVWDKNGQSNHMEKFQYLSVPNLQNKRRKLFQSPYSGRFTAEHIYVFMSKSIYREQR